tara:strand:- start:911 stop:1132 length:222 start_codon:yes stop_codon:yes gene_type:complete
MSIQAQRTAARQHCANFDCGNCLGAIMKVKRSKSTLGIFRTKLLMWIDESKAGKPCTVEKGCTYFINFVKTSE